MRQAILTGLLIAFILGITGCDDVIGPTAKKKAVAKKTTKETKKSTGQTQADIDRINAEIRQKAQAMPLTNAMIRSPNSRPDEYSSRFGSSTGSFGGSNMTDKQAIDQLGKAVQQALEVGPSLLIWVVDRSESCARTTTSTMLAAKSLYDMPDISAAASEGKLLTTVVGYVEKSELLLDPPVGDPAKVKDVLDSMRNEAGSKEMTFGALKTALETYLPLRTKERREVVVVLVTDEPGDDPNVADAVVGLTTKYSIPIYVIGPTMPLGNSAGMAMAGGGGGHDERTAASDAYHVDLVPMEFWTSAGGFGSIDNIDSGRGPWQLERVARQSGGIYLATSSVALGQSFDSEAMKKYAPEYISLTDYEKSIATNKCKQALIAAAKMEPSKALRNQRHSFPKQANEANMKIMLDKAQLDSARLEQGVNKIYDVLIAAEGDRSKLTNPRWQVAYDLALGRACAAKVRIDGYNAMLATLKRGKSFANEKSYTWIIEQADTIETGSAQQKLADKAKTYLTRVQDENAGTPWANFAQEELRTPLGWAFKEQ